MVALDTALLFLSAVGTVFALPASNEYDINGELVDSSAEKRGNYYPGM